jgi:hypothetical protein
LAACVDETAEWSQSEYLLARISDALEVSNYLFYQANRGEDSDDMAAPTPLPRPGQEEEVLEPESPSYASSDEVMDFFNRMNNL